MKIQKRWSIFFFDFLFYLLAAVFILVVYPGTFDVTTPFEKIIYMVVGAICIFIPRFLFHIYQRIWRYAGPTDYLWLVISDFVGFMAFVLLRRVIPGTLTFVRAASLVFLNLLEAICMRLVYEQIYQNRNSGTRMEKFLLKVLYATTGIEFGKEEGTSNRKIKIAIVGAGSIGVMLAEELLGNPKAKYQPVCFVDISKDKVGRIVNGLPVLSSDAVGDALRRYSVQEVVFALPNMPDERRKELYDIYSGLGYKIKTYDYPSMESADGQRRLRDFAIEDLLYRQSVELSDEQTRAWYCGKTILITGGGGSIGSELARQIAKAQPKKLILLDVYENGVYDIQQELKGKYKDQLNLVVEIANICDQNEVEKLFEHHKPDIVFHAAAHKHVPLMERNAVEAVKNNVFGTLNVVEASEKSGAKKFIMVSTDKAVNPTNVMGATKRMCEMIVQSRSGEKTVFSATRFGNVLGSNGSVIPLFKRQIANGGPITVTDKRIIRYFMTIPEASQLVMASGAMASNGELYVLDMGKPVKIVELAENMIRLSGLEPYKDIDIVEIGLRPGEKLYEELLIKSEELEKTENNKIFVERDKPLSTQEIQEKLKLLREAVATESNRAVKAALMTAVPTYRSPEEVNEEANQAEEMRIAKGA